MLDIAQDCCIHDIYKIRYSNLSTALILLVNGFVSSLRFCGLRFISTQLNYLTSITINDVYIEIKIRLKQLTEYVQDQFWSKYTICR